LGLLDTGGMLADIAAEQRPRAGSSSSRLNESKPGETGLGSLNFQPTKPAFSRLTFTEPGT